MNKKIFVAFALVLLFVSVVYLWSAHSNTGDLFGQKWFASEKNIAKILPRDTGSTSSSSLVAPPSLSAIAISEKEIRLNWQDINTNETGYEIERSIITSSGTKEVWGAISVGKNVTSYLDSGLSPLTTYYYRVRAKGNKGTSSSYSPTASATTFNAPPNPPSNLSAVWTGSTYAELTWTDNATNESGFKIERSIGSQNNWVQVGTTGANIISMDDAPSNTSITYYRVRAYNAAGDSSYSNIAPITPQTGCANTSSSLLPRDLWTWQSTVASDPTTRASFFAFADAHAIRTIYIESQGLISSNQSALASFIDEAKNEHCMNVELLFGNSDWALVQNHGTPVTLAQKSVQFAQGLSIKPVGVHFDVEPYALPEWTTDQNSVANQYLDLLEKIAVVTAGSGLEFTEDIPFWFDGRTVARNGVTRVLSEAIIDRTDRVTILAYRDTANSIFSLGSSEINYAQSAGKKATVGVETQCGSSDLEYITFCEEGAAYMEGELVKAIVSYGNSGAFTGFAVHDSKHYQLLKQ